MLRLHLAFHGHLPQTVKVATLKDAAAAFAAHKEALNLTAADIRSDCGAVRQGRKLVARVRFDGSVWAKGEEVVL